MTKYRLAAGVLILAITLFAGNVSAQKADREGPLGLTWGAAPDEVRTLGADLKDISGTEFGTSFVATKLPRALSDQDATILSFGYDDKLWRMVAVSKTFEHDPSGNALKARYQELLNVLTEKYGPPSSVQRLGDSIYVEPQYFLAGIKGGHTYWYSNFSTPSLSVQLGLTADDSSSGRWRIIYEDKSLRKAFDAAKRGKEKGAL
jgi:hypothetical protein